MYTAVFISSPICSPFKPEWLKLLPYAGLKGEKIGKDIKTVIKRISPDKIAAKVAFRSKKLGSRFNIKDKNPKKHEHNQVYKFKCF